MNKHLSNWSQMHDYPNTKQSTINYPVKRFTFVYTDLTTHETLRPDFKSKKDINKFFDSSLHYPLVIITKLVYETGCYKVLNESYI